MSVTVQVPTLSMPEYVLPWLGARTSTVLDHGFRQQKIGPDWWRRELERHGLTQAVSTFEHGDEQGLTRSDLFRLGTLAVQAEADDDTLLTFLWHVLAWGTDAKQRGNRQRVAALASPADRQRHVTLLRTALASAAAGDPHTAYNTLIRPGRAAIPGLGPAFFTKALYFASERTAGTRCLILDARVAGNLYEAGWEALPHRRGNFSSNWFTTTYVTYCELLQRWAAEATQELGSPVSPDEIERVLFEGPES